MSRRRAEPWTPEEDALIRENYLDMGDVELTSLLPGRSMTAICNRRSRFHLTKRPGFTAELQARLTRERMERERGWPNASADPVEASQRLLRAMACDPAFPRPAARMAAE